MSNGRSPLEKLAIDIWELFPELADETTPFVILMADYKEELEVSCLPCSLNELAEAIVNNSNFELEQKTLLTENEVAEFTYILSLKKIYNQLVIGRSQRVLYLKITDSKSTRIVIKDEISRESFIETFCESVED